MMLAIMQPYIFPYLGYFQLIKLSDRFVVYDDVNFIKKGWIHRNRIISNKYVNNDFEPLLFTVPLKDVSQNRLIKDTLIHENYISWRIKFLNTLNHTYKRAPNFDNGYSILEKTLDKGYPNRSISSLCLESIKRINKYLNINTEIIDSTTIYQNSHLKAQDRILDICKQERTDHYVNPIGGQELYKKEDFKKEGVELSFHKINNPSYPQFSEHFQPYLSIIDVIMFCKPCEIDVLLQQYQLVK